MGIDVEIAPRDRDDPVEVLDSRGVFADFLASAQLRDTICLQFIDPYGDTVFNSLQLPVLLEELHALDRLALKSDLRAHIASLIDLVTHALAGGPHTFVKFVGD